jgi:hypothetical protein
MTIINTTGMSFIGPGSEWFWTAISGLILVVTFLAIYRQLRITRSETANAQLAAFEQELDSERMVRSELELLLALRDGSDPADVPPGVAYVIGGFWERIGALAHRGHLDVKLLAQVSLGTVSFWWPAMEAFALRKRAERSQPGYLRDFEWLAGIVGSDLQPGAAAPLHWGEGALASLHTELIAILEDRVRMESALRSVTVVSSTGPSAGDPATDSLSRREPST